MGDEPPDIWHGEAHFTLFGPNVKARSYSLALCGLDTLHCVPKKVTPKYKSQQLRQILPELNVLSAAFIIAFLAQTLQISTKSIAQWATAV